LDWGEVWQGLVAVELSFDETDQFSGESLMGPVDKVVMAGMALYLDSVSVW
jgi:hypothetical protein